MAVMRTNETSADPPGWETIEELFIALESLLLAYARRYTGDTASAEEVVQEAFMKLHTQFDTVAKPRPWLYRTVHNLALNQRRAAGRTVSLTAGDTGEEGGEPAPDLPDPALLPDEQIIRLEAIGLVRISVAALEPRSREVVRLKFTEELSYQDIAARTGLTTGNVGFILHHALKTIASELAKTGAVP